MQLSYASTMLAPGGVVKLCGLRFAGVSFLPGSLTEAEVIDGSISIHENGTGVVKAALQQGSMKSGNVNLNAVDKEISWLRVEGTPALKLGPKWGPADKEGFSIATTNFDESLAALDGLLRGKRLWASFSKANTSDSVFSGADKPSDDVRSELLACINELSSTQKK